MKKIKTCNSLIKKILLSTFALYSTQALSLVDYTEKSSFRPRNSGAQSVQAKSSPAPSSTRRSQTSLSSSAPRTRSGFFSTGIYYQNDEVKLGETSGNVSRMGINAHFETPYNIYLDARYSQAKLSSDLLSEDAQGSSFESGNPEMVVGFNWLEFGSQMDAAHIDFLAGLSFGQDSLYATQRTDKIVGISTAKRFYDFALGLGYQLIITGDSDETEMSIGNISKLTASIGWVVSQDIRFLVEANSYSIGRSTDELAVNKLQEKTKVSVISPQLILGISPLVDLTLGAHMATRRLQDDQLLGAKLWNIDGMYGNALYVKMGLNL